MLLELSNIELFTPFFDLIHDTADTIELRILQDKLVCSLLNKSHVAFYNVEYDKYFFDVYDIEDVDSIFISVNDFYNILKSASNNDTLILTLEEFHLKCVFESNDNRRVFELPLIEDYITSPDPPSIDYDGWLEVSLNQLKKSCNDLDKIVRTHKFQINAEGYKISIKSSVDSFMNYVQELPSTSLNVNGGAVVDLNYINELNKLSKINDYVELGLKDDMPLSWKVCSIDESIKINGLIAPILEENE